MIIADVQGGRYSPLTTPTGKVLWVDIEKGNDSIARRGFMTVPFATLAAAKNAAASGDTIVVLPGNHTTTEQLAKDGVNWHFLNGAIASTNTASISLFYVSSAMSFRVTGAGWLASGGSANHVLHVSHSSADVYFQAWKIIGADSAVNVSAGVVVIDADWLHGDESSAIDVAGGTVSIRARLISSDQLHAIYNHGGTLDVDAFQIKSTGGKGILFSSGTARIRAFEILATTAPAVEYTYSGTLTIQNARLVSQWNNTAGRAVYASGGSGGIKLECCTLICHTTADYSIHAAGNFTVQFHGMCTGSEPMSGFILPPQLVDHPIGGFNYSNNAGQIT